MSTVLDERGHAVLRRALAGRVAEGTPLAAVPIADPAIRRLVRGALDVVLGDRLDRLRSTSATLGRLVPGTELLAAQPFTSRGLAPRLERALVTAGWHRWSDLAGQRVQRLLALPAVGARAGVELLGWCFDCSAGALVEAWCADPRAGDLGVVLRHEQAMGRQPVLQALLEHATGDVPTAAGEAAGRLLTALAPAAVHVEAALRAVREAAGDERHRMAFDLLSLPRGARPAAGELAERLGVTSARVRQLREVAEARVRDALSTSPPWLGWLVASLSARLGRVATEEQTRSVLSRLGAAGEPVADVALWLAGPYREVPGRPGWLATDARPLVAATSACLDGDGGVRRLTDVAAELADVGVRADQLEGWLAASGAVVVHDVAVRVVGSLADAVERLLDAHGSARSTAEIGAELARGGRAVETGTLAALGRHHRFRTVAAGRLALTTWTDHATGATASGNPGGPPTVPGHPARSSRRQPTEPGADHRSRVCLTVPVDADVLRGCEGAVPVALVDGLHMSPRTRRTFSSRYGPVGLSYDVPQPRRGSVRAVALAAGATVGDLLVLGFGPAGDVAVEVRPGLTARPTGRARRPGPQAPGGSTDTAGGGAP